jgi:hypothetical protein
MQQTVTVSFVLSDVVRAASALLPSTFHIHPRGGIHSRKKSRV